MTRSIQNEDFGSSKIWGTVFGACSLAARLVLLEAGVRSSKNNLMEGSPCARKDSPPFFLPYISNDCLAIERRSIANVDVDKIEAAEASVDPGARLLVLGLDRRDIVIRAKKCLVGERPARGEAVVAQLGGEE